MQMTDIEIVGSFRRADNKKEQIKILSELNACSKEKVIDILKRNGVPMEEYEPKKRGRKPSASKQVPKEVTEMEHNEGKTGTEVLEDSIEEPTLTDEQREQMNRALAIPTAVRIACQEKVDSITTKVIELERERDTLCDYLNGVICND